ncbi:hypothetical protein L7F22_052646 [Adiantum nelumboides]|nr:hypothetical protein [Adiantum nelumboides]
MAPTNQGVRPMEYTNALIHSTSPYLLQHAHNPVDWQPWSQAALDQAKKEGKMIFLSSGYSACHWCHVMAHESFENISIAKMLNESFVCVKVDREERPDVDAAYMTFVQATSGRGGWPMSVFLTNEGEPLFGGTYFPPPMFKELIDRLTSLWEEDRQRCLSSARDISQQLRQVASAGVAGTDWSDLPPLNVTAKTLKHWLLSFDQENGGFGNAPKFPSPPNTFYFLHRIAAEIIGKSTPSSALSEIGIGSDSASKAIESSAFTLARIARGGISDPLAGGIARYSVDEEWRVPHFEKMLYDQGQLLTSFSEALQLCLASSESKLQQYTHEFRQTITGIIEYLERYMTSKDGSIYAAEDADSLPTPESEHAKEGAFYVWDSVEIENVLGGKDSKACQLVSSHFGIRLEGNIPAESDPHGELVGKNVLHASTTLLSTAEKLEIAEEEAKTLWNTSKQKLLAYRDQRPRPLCDDKIITAWNGLAISGLAKASQVLGKDSEIGKKALKLANDSSAFLWNTMWNKEKHQFLRSYRDGVQGPLGFDVDYAFVIQGLLDLYEVTFDTKYIEQALQVQAAQDSLFWDDEGGPGGYLISSKQSDGNILGRQRGDQEGAEPTSTSVSAHNLLRLQSLISNLDQELAKRSEVQGRQASSLSSHDRIAQCITSGGAILERAPHALGTRITALLRAKLGSQQVIIVGPSGDKNTIELLNVFSTTFLPRASVIHIDTTEGKEGAQKQLGQSFIVGNDAVREVLEDPKLLTRGSYATVCQDFACGLPITTSEELLKQLQK